MPRESRSTSTHLIVISGGSGTGKSTLSKALQEALLPETWLHFSVDTVLYCLPESVLDRANHHNDWSSVDSRLISSSAFACACALLDAGHKVIFECVALTERRAHELLSAFHRHRPIFVGLFCSWEETKRRTLARGDRTLAEAEFGYHNAGKHLPHEFTFETTDTASDVVATELVRCLRERASDQGAA